MLKVSQKYVIFDYFIQKNAVILNFKTNESFSSKEIVAWYVNIGIVNSSDIRALFVCYSGYRQRW